MYIGREQKDIEFGLLSIRREGVRYMTTVRVDALVAISSHAHKASTDICKNLTFGLAFSPSNGSSLDEISYRVPEQTAFRK